MELGDAEALFPMFADPEIWWFDPDEVHRDAEATRKYVALVASRWPVDGLGYWTVRLRSTGDVIGSGGAQRHAKGEWNLNYRIARAHQGHGYATEVLRAALSSAVDTHPTAPCIAWIDEVNGPSIRVAGRAGLDNRGSRIGSYDGRPRLAFSDRPLDATLYPLS